MPRGWVRAAYHSMDAAGNQLPSTPAPPGEIFVVDDDPADQRDFERILRQSGLPHRCRFFASGDALLDTLIDVLRGAPPPVACFLDVKMSGMTGLDVLRWVRAQPSLNRVAVIMLSSSDDPHYLELALQFGAQCYTTKFPEAPQLRQIVEAAERHAADLQANHTFALPCNLLASHSVEGTR